MFISLQLIVTVNLIGLQYLTQTCCIAACLITVTHDNCAHFTRHIYSNFFVCWLASQIQLLGIEKKILGLIYFSFHKGLFLSAGVMGLTFLIKTPFSKMERNGGQLSSAIKKTWNYLQPCHHRMLACTFVLSKCYVICQEEKCSLSFINIPLGWTTYF